MPKKSGKLISQEKNVSGKPSVLFMGTSLFAKNILNALVKDGYDIIAVYSQPDKKSGRKNEIIISPVKEYCLEKNLKLYQPEKLDKEIEMNIKKLSPNLIVVAAYGKILPQDILAIPDLGSVNVHASLLPRYRGASPIQNALLAGDNKTGVTIMLMDKNIDSGDILSQAEIEIDNTDTTETLSAKLAELGTDQILKTIPLWTSGKISPKKQDGSRSTFCKPIRRGDGHIIWNEKAVDIYNKFRAFQPWPGVFSFWNKKEADLRLKLRKISLEKNNKDPQRRSGQVFSKDGRVLVQTSSGSIILIEVQLEGKGPIAIKNFINGHQDFIGSILE